MSLTKVTYSMISGAAANVLDYGADPTNTANSTAAFQAAIDTGLTVYIPNGSYKVGALTILQGQSIVGESRNGVLIFAQGSIPIISWDWDTNGNVVLKNAQISNFTIRADDFGDVPMIKLIGAQYCSVSNLYFWDYTAATEALGIYLEFSYFCTFSNILCNQMYSGIRFYGADYSRGPNQNSIIDFNGNAFRHYGIRFDYARGNVINTIDLEYGGDNLYYGVIFDNSSYNQIKHFWYEANYASTASAAILIQGDTASTNKKNSVIWSPQIIHPSNAIEVKNSLDTTLDNIRFVGGTVNVQDDGNTNLVIINPQSESPSIGLLSSGSPTTKIIDYDTDFLFIENSAANLVVDSINDGYNSVTIKSAGTTKFSATTKPSTNEVSLNTADGEVLRIQNGTGFPVPVKGAFQFVNSIASAGAAANCLFVDSADGILKFKDGSSVVHSLY